MRHLDGAAVANALPYGALAKALEAAFRDGVTTPLRSHHAIELPQGTDGAMLVMPAWKAGRYVVVKMVSIFPDNAKRGLDSVQGIVVLIDATTGQPLATLDGPEITGRRTAAASALAAQYLAREDAQRLLVMGAGTLGAHLARAHAAVRPIRKIDVWNRTPERAARLAAALRDEGFDASAVTHPEESMRNADIVTCATMSPEPLVHGALLKPGAHVDVVGAYRRDMRETDDNTVRRARIFVDTREGALAEAGDVLLPIDRGVITEQHILGDLTTLCRGPATGRTGAAEITMFKSVGTAVEDWAAAVMAYEAWGASPS
ncbi:MAG: ornithine cyclodeaminase family protein [Proteobacteria bacterium]|nr:ornithine cyclodeaminase family protein [Pseudomonadota bacterium]MDA1058767.1 ornithine cyclodeaminase family protein [Pseudomonadota bacterium]